MSERTAEGFRQFVYQGPDMPELAPASSLQMERDESEETVAHYTMGAGLEAMRRDTTSSFEAEKRGSLCADPAVRNAGGWSNCLDCCAHEVYDMEAY